MRLGLIELIIFAVLILIVVLILRSGKIRNPLSFVRRTRNPKSTKAEREADALAEILESNETPRWSMSVQCALDDRGRGWRRCTLYFTNKRLIWNIHRAKDKSIAFGQVWYIALSNVQANKGSRAIVVKSATDLDEFRFDSYDDYLEADRHLQDILVMRAQASAS